MGFGEIISIVIFVVGGLISAVWAISSQLGKTIVNRLTNDMSEMKGDIKKILDTLDQNGKMGVKHEMQLIEHQRQLEALWSELKITRKELDSLIKSHYSNHAHEKDK